MSKADLFILETYINMSSETAAASSSGPSSPRLMKRKKVSRSVAADEAWDRAVHKVTDETNFPPVLHFDPSLQMSVACPQLVEWLKTEKATSKDSFPIARIYKLLSFL